MACEIDGAQGSFDFVRLAPHFAQDDSVSRVSVSVDLP